MLTAKEAGLGLDAAKVEAGILAEIEEAGEEALAIVEGEEDVQRAVRLSGVAKGLRVRIAEELTSETVQAKAAEIAAELVAEGRRLLDLEG